MNSNLKTHTNNFTFMFFLCSFLLAAQKNLSIDEGVFISLPKEIHIVEGNKLEIFKNSIVHAINPENYFLSINIIDGTPKGFFYDRKFEYDCEVGDEMMILEFVLKNNNLEVLDKQEVTIIPVTKATQPSVKKNILLIGDSFTKTPTYPNELARRLVNSDGIPKGDALANITFIGTSPTDANLHREGHGGKSWSFFLENDSPFWNEKTRQIDFENYCKVNGFSKIDAVVILLGTNDISTDAIVSKFLDILLSYNPAIKGIVTGKILPTPFGGTGSVGLIANQYFFSNVKKSLNYNRRMESLIAQRYKDRFLFVDILASFDTEYNMRYDKVPANNRNKTLVKQGIDNVHPDESGYLQIADIIYNGFHHFILK